MGMYSNNSVRVQNCSSSSLRLPKYGGPYMAPVIYCSASFLVTLDYIFFLPLFIFSEKLKDEVFLFEYF